MAALCRSRHSRRLWRKLAVAAAHAAVAAAQSREQAVDAAGDNGGRRTPPAEAASRPPSLLRRHCTYSRADAAGRRGIARRRPRRVPARQPRDLTADAARRLKVTQGAGRAAERAWPGVARI